MWKNIILAISLAMNVFVLGYAGYSAYQFRSFIGGDKAQMEMHIDKVQNRFLRHLEGQDKVAAERIINARRPIITKAVRELHAARRDAMQTLRTETPDSAKLAAALSRSQEATSQLNEALHGGLRDMARDLSPEARRKLGKRIRHHGDN